MFRRFLLAAMIMANGGLLTAQTETSATLTLRSVSADAVPGESDDAAALRFLSVLEAKNAETKSLSAEFTQIRTDSVMFDEVKSSGKFWYQSPNKFRASYKSDNSSEIWMDGERMVEHIPSMKQVYIVPMDSGDDAPISQLLLGFGVKVSKIQKLFTIKSAKAPNQSIVSINFISKDLDKTMNFSGIRVDFDRASAKPLTINLQDDQSSITMNLRKIELNPKLKADVFEVPKKWPEGTDVSAQ
ncbi:hypothetical protein BH09SUM1_BH09SUM1_21480 [soil metagenome]